VSAHSTPAAAIPTRDDGGGTVASQTSDDRSTRYYGLDGAAHAVFRDFVSCAAGGSRAAQGGVHKRGRSSARPRLFEARQRAPFRLARPGLRISPEIAILARCGAG